MKKTDLKNKPLFKKKLKKHKDDQKITWCEKCSLNAKVFVNNYENEKKRLFSEIINAQKRFEVTLKNQKKYQNYDFILNLLEVYDVLGMALQFKITNEETKKFLIGVKMANEKLTKLLSKYDVKQIDAKLGDEFNPELHEAIAIEHQAKKRINSIIRIAKKGYLLHERLLRPAQVIINQIKNIEGDKKNE